MDWEEEELKARNEVGEGEGLTREHACNQNPPGLRMLDT